MTDDSFRTLGEFLEQTGATVRVFDLGRRITEIGRDHLQQIEMGRERYPQPYLQQAWTGWVFWDAQRGDDPMIWFLRFPLDEQGLLSLPARDAFLDHVLKCVGRRLNPESNDTLDQTLGDSPYTFRPRDDRLAVFHARVARLLGRDPSRFYAHARDYLSGQVGYDQWAFVGIQGLADVAARWADGDNAELLAVAVPDLPVEPFVALCGCLENERIPGHLARSLIERARGEETPDVVAAAVRGISFSSAEALRREYLAQVLAGAGGRNAVVLAAVAGRAWGDLTDPQLLLSFLEALAVNSGGAEVFQELVVDLLQVPGLRETVMSAFRSPDRSVELAQAIGALLGAVRGNA